MNDKYTVIVWEVLRCRGHLPGAGTEARPLWVKLILCHRQPQRWPPVIPTSWDSHLVSFPSPPCPVWVCTGPSDSFLAKRILKKQQEVTSELGDRKTSGSFSFSHFLLALMNPTAYGEADVEGREGASGHSQQGPEAVSPSAFEELNPPAITWATFGANPSATELEMRLSACWHLQQPCEGPWAHSRCPAKPHLDSWPTETRRE